MTAIETAPTSAIPNPSGLHLLVLVVLVAAGDFLLFAHGGGAALFIFDAVVAFTVAALNIRATPRSSLLGLAIAILAAVPLLEAPSLQAIVVAGLGVGVLALGTARLLPASAETLPRALSLYAIAAPFLLFRDTLKVRFLRLSRLKRELVMWTIPIVFVGIFGWLFASANAVFAEIVGTLSFGSLLAQLNFERICFWVVLASAVWAVLQPRLASWQRRVKPAAPASGDEALETAGSSGEVKESLLFGRAMLVRSLIAFNALFLVETGLDLTYLWGRVQLPDGLTYADYAHRGAFPLIATALLAAAFVLVAMRPNGPGEDSRLIRGLVYGWLAQNVLLCLSAMLRLDLYVEAYSLTEWRVAAGIWMALVAAGLVLIVLRILLKRSNQWLLAMNLATLTLTLYATALTDFSPLIANFNIARGQGKSDHNGQWLDFAYLASLGPTTVPGIDAFLTHGEATRTERSAALEVRKQLVAQFDARDRDWRNWSFRDARLSDYLAGHSEPKATGWLGPGATVK